MKQTIKEQCLLTGDNIRRERIRQNISQELLAYKIGKTAQYISLLENGGRCGSLPTYLDIANAFDLGLGELFTSRNKEEDSPLHEGTVLELLSGCTAMERRILTAICIAVKDILREERGRA
jgi:transcriptional regulator with XRE-family HTH domain